VKEEAGDLERWAVELECRSARSPQIAWGPLQQDPPNENSDEGSSPTPDSGPLSLGDITSDVIRGPHDTELRTDGLNKRN
jgi:hypothetical protein